MGWETASDAQLRTWAHGFRDAALAAHADLFTFNESPSTTGESANVRIKIAKIIRFNRTRTDIGVDVNNLFNTGYASAYNTTYIYNTDNQPRVNGWGTPTNLIAPRFVRLNFTVNF